MLKTLTILQVATALFTGFCGVVSMFAGQTFTGAVMVMAATMLLASADTK